MVIEPDLINLLVILLYVLLFGGLSLVRGEGLSARFALESLALGGGILGLSLALGEPVSPVLLLVALYLVTMRARWLTELANMVGRGGGFAAAQRLYRLGLSLWPDAASRQVVLLNQAAMWLKVGEPQTAREILEPLLRAGERLSPRHRAAGHYNLGLAYERLGQDDRAVRHYNAATEALPGSVYALGAQAALRRRKQSAQATKPDTAAVSAEEAETNHPHITENTKGEHGSCPD
ncbi:MAG: tetratricopeptide repeat protein [Anaerolineae bacterium]